MKLHHRVLRALSRLAAGTSAAAGDPAEIKALLEQTARVDAAGETRGEENVQNGSVSAEKKTPSGRKGKEARSANEEEPRATGRAARARATGTVMASGAGEARAGAAAVRGGGAPDRPVHGCARCDLEAVVAECDEALFELGVLPEGGDAREAREAEEAAPAPKKTKGAGRAQRDAAPPSASGPGPRRTWRRASPRTRRRT